MFSGWPEKSEYDDKITPPGQRQERKVAGGGTWRTWGNGFKSNK